MDTRESEEIAEEVRRQFMIRHFGKESPSWSELREFAWKTNNETIKIFTDELMSRWTRGDKRFYYSVFKVILEEKQKTDNMIFIILEKIDNLEKAAIQLGKESESTKGKNTELTESLSSLKEYVEPKLAATFAAMKRLDELLEGNENKNKQKDDAKIKDRSGSYRV